jgi:hypothetical protein
MKVVADICETLWSRSTAESMYYGLLLVFPIIGGAEAAETFGKFPSLIIRICFAFTLGALGHFVQQQHRPNRVLNQEQRPVIGQQVGIRNPGDIEET